MPSYILDFKNITSPAAIQDCLNEWTVRKLSERTFAIVGREYNKTDLIRLYQWIAADGHIFICDLENGEEVFYQRHPRGRRQEKAIDADLDTRTLQCISEFQVSQSG